ncbi:MAG TPA: protocatechuate 4,5-dioxygenase subunit alpha [Steroidobacteraceae bacterium]|jgi:protocatechuate 4,5-dioxygenase alpha chain
MADDSVRREPIDGFDDIPGTTLFDAQRARQGYWVNQFCMSLMKAANREEFKADEDKYLRKWKMSDEQREAILKRNWARMIELGGNIYYLSKLFSTDGKSFQYVAATMTGLTQEQYAAMMLHGGRTIDLNRSKQEWARTGGPAFGKK